MRSLYVLCALVALSPAAGWSQDADVARLGERVRVRVTEIDPLVGPAWLLGTYGGTRNDSILIMDGLEERFAYPVGVIRELDVLRCCQSRREGMWKGVFWGAAAGTVVGVASASLGCLTGHYLCERSNSGFWVSLATFTLTRAALGTVVGAIWGSRRPGRIWTPLEVPGSLHVGIPPGGDRSLGFGVSIQIPR